MMQRVMEGISESKVLLSGAVLWAAAHRALHIACKIVCSLALEPKGLKLGDEREVKVRERESHA